jgi:type IV secretion system protein VirB9
MIRAAAIGSMYLVAALTFGAAPAAANDARLESRLFNPKEIVRVEGRADVQTTIAFANDEHIENVAIGNSNSWQVTPNKRANLLFIKPSQPRARTNLTVITDKRSYFFDLVASPAAAAVYELRFTYPQEPAAPPPPPRTRSERAVDLATLNFAWRSRGKAALLPSRIYDDGRSVYLTWRAGSPVPAILARNAKGEEGPVNFAVRGDVIVIDGVPDRLIFRTGSDSATTENQRQARGRTSPPALAAASSTQLRGQ